MNKHINTSPKPPTQYVPQIPVGVEQIILCALEKDPTRRYQSASQMLRHIYRVQQNPATVFQKQTPSRTTTADVAIKLTSEKSENAEKSEFSAQNPRNTSGASGNGKKPKQHTASHPKSPMRSTPLAETNKSQAGALHKKKKHEQSENVPFSAVILICTVFCILAIIGFFLLFNLLYKGNASEATPLISSIQNVAHDIGNTCMEMRRI